MTFNPTGTELRVCQLIAQRQAFGVNKYGTTVAQNPLSLRQWLQHGLEEALDLAVYLQRSIEELDRSGPTPPVAQDPSGAAVASDPSGPEPVAADPITDYYQDRNNGAHAAKAP